MSENDSTEQVVKDLDEMNRKYRESHTLQFKYVEFFELYAYGNLVGRFNSKEQSEEALCKRRISIQNSHLRDGWSKRDIDRLQIDIDTLSGRRL